MALLCFCSPIHAARSAFVVFLDSASAANAAQPYYATFNGTTWTSQTAMAAPTVTAGTAAGSHYVLRANPVRNEMVAVWRNNAASPDELYAEVYNGSTWGNAQTITEDGSASPAQRTFDVGIEGLSGKVWVVYRKLTSGGPSAYSWSGTAWTSVGAIGGLGWPAAGVQWIRLQGKKNSNEMTLVIQFTGSSGIWASVYNGTTWSSPPKQLEVSPPPVADTTQAVDLAYQSSNGKCVALWVRDGSGSSNTFVTIQHSAGVWDATSTIVSAGTNLPAQADAVRHIRIAANPLGTSNEVMAVWLDEILTLGTVTDANAMIWNGASWGNAVELAANSSLIRGTVLTARPFDAVWTSTGTGYAIWNRLTAGVPSFRAWSGGAWSGTTSSGGDIGAQANHWYAAGSTDAASSQIILFGKDSTATNVTRAQLLGGASVQILTNSAGATAAHPTGAVAWQAHPFPDVTVTNVTPNVGAPTSGRVPILKVTVKNNNPTGSVNIEVSSIAVKCTSDGSTALTSAGMTARFSAVELWEDSAVTGSFQADQDVLIASRTVFGGITAGGQLIVDTGTALTPSAVAPQQTKTYFVVANVSASGAGAFAFSIDADKSTADGGEIACRDAATDFGTEINATTAVTSATRTIYTPASPAAGYPVSVSTSPFVVGTTLSGTLAHWYAACTNGQVYKYSLGGTLQWATTLASSTALQCPILYSSEGGSNYLYVASDSGNLYKLQDNGTTYSETWAVALNAAATFRTRPLKANIGGTDYIFVGGSDGLVYKRLASNGAAATPGTVGPSPAAGVTGAGVALTFETISGDASFRPYAFWGDASGRINKAHADDMTLPSTGTVTIAGVTSISAPMLTFDNTRMVFGCNNSAVKVYNMDTAFSETFTFTADGTVSPPFVVGRSTGTRVYFGSSAGTVYCRTTVLGAVWSASLGTAITGQPSVDLAIAPTRVFAATDDGYLYALNAADGTTLSGWPVFTGGQVQGMMVYGGFVYATTGGGKVHKYAVP